MRNILLTSWRTNLMLLLQLVIYTFNNQLGRLGNGMEPYGIVFWQFSLPILITTRGRSDAWGYALLQAVGGQRGQKGRPGHINCPTWMEGNYPIICNCTQLQFIMLRSTMSEDILRLQSGQDTFPSNDLSPWNVMNKHNLPTVVTWFCFQAWLTLMDFKGCY